MKFAELTAPTIQSLERDKLVVVAPIAACEQHGPRLPVFTDTILVTAVAEAVEREHSSGTLLLPTLWMGASEHHLPLGGTLTATLATYEQMLVELLTPSLRTGFTRILVLNGHGGNNDPLRIALRRLDVAYPGRLLTGAAYWEIAHEPLEALCEGPLKAMGHACEIETSMMLHLRPDLVRSHSLGTGREQPRENPANLFWARDFSRGTNQGVIGFPSFATAEKGALIFSSVVSKVVETIQFLLNVPLV